jgi:hypothetical protein
MRVSPTSPQRNIEIATSEEWRSAVVFKNKFPAVLDPNEIYWMKPAPAEKPDTEPDESKASPVPEEPEPQPFGLGAIGFQETPILSGVPLTRSLSSSDLRTFAAKPDAPPKSDLMIMWVVQFGAQVTQIWAPENTPVVEICDRAAHAINLPMQRWDIRGPDRRGSVATIYCKLPGQDSMEAAIHFGNQECRGKVNVLCSDLRLVQEA